MNKIIIPFIHSNNELKIACQNNLIESVMSNTIPFNWNYGLYGSSLSNNKILIKKMIELGANDFQWGFRGLCEKGDVSMIMENEKILQEISNVNKINYDWALAGACIGNNIEAVKYLLTKEIKDINSATRIIFENCYDKLIDIFLNSYSNKIDFSFALAAACFGYRNNNNKNYSLTIINNLLLNLNGNYFDCALYESSFSGLDYVIEKIINRAQQINKKINLVHIIRGSTLGNHINILKKYINLDEEFFKIGYYEAAYKNDKELIKWYENNYDLEEYKIYYLTGLCQSKNNKECTGCCWCNK